MLNEAEALNANTTQTFLAMSNFSLEPRRFDRVSRKILNKSR